LQAAHERIQVAEAAVAQAEESARITRNRYEAGLATVTDLLRTETALLDASTRRLAAIYDQRVAATLLELASGALTGDSNVLQ
jgi:outer membrane protein TolC